MSGFSYIRTVNNKPILDLSRRSGLTRSIESINRRLFSQNIIPSFETPTLPLPTVPSEPAPWRPRKKTIFNVDDTYTALLDWEKAREDRGSWDKIWLRYHPEPKVHTDIIKKKDFGKYNRVTQIRVFRPPGITSDTLTEIIKKWTGRTDRIRVPLP